MHKNSEVTMNTDNQATALAKQYGVAALAKSILKDGPMGPGHLGRRQR
jgi:hypothetical protein